MRMSTKRLLALARMQQVHIFAVIAVALVVVLGSTALAQAVGAWKLNLAKSKYQQGQAPKSTTLVYEAAGAGIKVTVDTAPPPAPRSTTPSQRTMTGRMFLSSAT